MKLFASLFTVFVLSSCGSSFKQVTAIYDHSTDFTSYKTYAWLDKGGPHSETPYDNEIVENNIKNYVDTELENRNLTADPSAPDLLFELILRDKEKTKTATVPVYNSPQYYPYPVNSYRYYSRNNYRWNQHRYSDNNYIRPSYQIGTRLVTTQYNRSTITINVIERKKNRLIWSGSAKGNIYDDNYKQSDIHPAIMKILARYPVKAIK